MSVDIDVSTCNGCGAPIPAKPTLHHPIKCDYCDLTNYLKRSAISSEEVKSIDEDTQSENYYLIFQESQKILENFPGELVGEEVGKLRIKMQIKKYAFPLLIVLDDLPDKPYIDGPNKLREVLNCEINDLSSLKNWVPGSSSTLDVLEEIYQKAEVSLPGVMKETDQKDQPTTQEDRDPLVREILANYDAKATKKEIIVNFYAQNGDVVNFTIKRKKNLPIGLESEILTKYPLIRGPLEDYAKGRIDLFSTLSEIEKMFYA